MSVEHRRQLLAFLIVALAAVLLIGNGLYSDTLRGVIKGESGTQAAITSGVTLVPGRTSPEPGGAARGTTTIASDSTTGATSVRSEGSRSSSPTRVAPGRSAQAPSVRDTALKSKSSGHKHSGKGSTRGSARTTDARVVADGATTVRGTKAHAKKAHGKKAHGMRSGRHDH